MVSECVLIFDPDDPDDTPIYSGIAFCRRCGEWVLGGGDLCLDCEEEINA